jgi:hypothetical protein
VAFSVISTGAPEAARHLHELGERSADQTKTMTAEAKRVQRGITGVARDSGRLQASVRGGAETLREVTAEGYTIGSKVPYARMVFGGTRYMDAQPPKVPEAAQGAAKAISRDLERT